MYTHTLQGVWQSTSSKYSWFGGFFWMMSHVPTVFIVAIEYNNFCNKPSPQFYYNDSNCCRGLQQFLQQTISSGYVCYWQYTNYWQWWSNEVISLPYHSQILLSWNCRMCSPLIQGIFQPVSLPRSSFFNLFIILAASGRYRADTWCCTQYCLNRIQSKIQS